VRKSPVAAMNSAKANVPHPVAMKRTGMTPLSRTLYFLAVSYNARSPAEIRINGIHMMESFGA